MYELNGLYDVNEAKASGLVLLRTDNNVSRENDVGLLMLSPGNKALPLSNVLLLLNDSAVVLLLINNVFPLLLPVNEEDLREVGKNCELLLLKLNKSVSMVSLLLSLKSALLDAARKFLLILRP